MSLEDVTELLMDDILPQIKSIKKNSNQIIQDNKRKTFLFQKWNERFDIAKCCCFLNKPKNEYIYETCTCLDEDKVDNLDNYMHQIFDEKSVICISADEYGLSKCFAPPQGYAYEKFKRFADSRQIDRYLKIGMEAKKCMYCEAFFHQCPVCQGTIDKVAIFDFFISMFILPYKKEKRG